MTDSQTKQKIKPKPIWASPNLRPLGRRRLANVQNINVLNSPNLCEDVQTNVLDCNFLTLVELIINECTEKNNYAPMHLFQLANKVVS